LFSRDAYVLKLQLQYIQQWCQLENPALCYWLSCF